MACINGRAVPLSRDHKPTLKDERKRIEEAGGFVEYKRVNGNLALSRALGDFIFKRNDRKSPQEQIVTGSEMSNAIAGSRIFALKDFQIRSVSRGAAIYRRRGLGVHRFGVRRHLGRNDQRGGRPVRENAFSAYEDRQRGGTEHDTSRGDLRGTLKLLPGAGRPHGHRL